MDDVQTLFDNWSDAGKDKDMEIGHKSTVLPFLNTIDLKEKFTFLDIGCGNGWTVREISKKENCVNAVGIDKSFKMIQKAISLSSSSNEQFIHSDIESFDFEKQFDFIFSMEVLYYVKDITKAIKNIYRLLRPQGKLLFGTDFYFENKKTIKWKDDMDVNMYLFSIQEWINIFSDGGFNTSVKQVRDSNSTKSWKRDLGTLFLVGTRK